MTDDIFVCPVVSRYATPSYSAHPAQMQLWDTSATSSLRLGESADWVIDAAKKLSALRVLERGWDSYDGLPLSEAARELTVQVLTWLKELPLPTPEVAMGSDGTVQFEWRSPNRELDVLLRDGKDIECVTVDELGNIAEKRETEALEARLFEWTNWFSNG